MNKTTSFNTYDILLFILVLCLPLYRYGGTFRTPGFILSIAYFPFLLEYIFRWSSTWLKPFFLFFSFWLLYSFVSLLWTPLEANARVELTMLFVHSTMFLEILVIAQKAKSSLSTLSNAWTTILLLTVLVGIWEIYTGHHLMNVREESAFRTNELNHKMFNEYAAVTFYNYNTYCWFICFCFPFLLHNLSRSKSFVYYAIIVVILSLSLYIMFINASRGGIVTLMIMLCIYFYNITFKAKNARSRLYLIALLLFGTVAVLEFSNIFDTIMFRLAGKSAFEDNTRLVLWNSSFELFLDSYGFGKGVGSMVPALRQFGAQGTFIYYSHNMLLEFLLVYGLAVTLGFVYFLWRLLKKAFIVRDINRKIVLLSGIIPFPIYSIINSENIFPTPVWCFFASLCVFALPFGKNTTTKRTILTPVIHVDEARTKDDYHI